ncbi:MAG: hypothetical protein KC619_27925, partial [Myxococcales bacterium]|nr:hypothetical protein [Myxococcales bacterium]
MRPRTAIPPMAALAIALVVSGGIHVPVYVGLGILEKLLEARDIELAQAQPMEVELIEGDVPHPPEPETPAPIEEDEEAPPEVIRHEHEREDEPEPQTARAPTPEPAPEPPAIAPPAPAAAP